MDYQWIALNFCNYTETKPCLYTIRQVIDAIGFKQYPNEWGAISEAYGKIIKKKNEEIRGAWSIFRKKSEEPSLLNATNVNPRFYETKIKYEANEKSKAIILKDYKGLVEEIVLILEVLFEGLFSGELQALTINSETGIRTNIHKEIWAKSDAAIVFCNEKVGYDAKIYDSIEDPFLRQPRMIQGWIYFEQQQAAAFLKLFDGTNKPAQDNKAQKQIGNALLPLGGADEVIITPITSTLEKIANQPSKQGRNGANPTERRKTLIALMGDEDNIKKLLKRNDKGKLNNIGNIAQNLHQELPEKQQPDSSRTIETDLNKIAKDLGI